jgi:hypothetical protein
MKQFPESTWTFLAILSIVLIVVFNVWIFKQTDMKATLPMPPDGRAMKIHWDGCKECQKIDEYGRLNELCTIMLELHREYCKGSENFRMGDRNGVWVYDGQPIKGWIWNVKQQEWVAR